MIAIIDYQSGNVRSVANALERIGESYVITAEPEEILRADKVIFPGQGRAGQAMGELRALGLVEVLKQIRVPFLGICLGMQLLYEYTEEDETKGLGILSGKVRKFKSSKELKVPLVGWNTVVQIKYDKLFEEISDTLYAYFVNSYYAPAEGENVLASYSYGSTRAAAIVKKDNFYGTQFHPEKSGALGIQMLKNFCNLPSPPRKGEIKRGCRASQDVTPSPRLPWASTGRPSASRALFGERNPLLLIPAIDIMDGRCVRLRQGRFKDKTVYAKDPLAAAQSFIDKGAEYLHIIDLDGAKAGEPKNTETVLSIVRGVSVPVQAGGGMRSEDTVREYLEAGVARVILGTSALAKPELIPRLIAEYGPGRIMVSADGKDGKVAVKGWQETADIGVIEFIQKLQALGVTTIIYTDVARDGELQGPNFEMIAEVLKFPVKVIVAGGVTTVAQAQQLQGMGAYGVIVGKALYEGKFNLSEAIKHIAQPTVFNLLPKITSQPTKRIIACMDITDGRVKKGTHFVQLRDAGDPVELGKLYRDMGIDELMFLDITATIENRATMYQLVERVAREVDIPFAVGGGVKTIDDIRELLQRGADKVSIGSAAVKHPEFVKEAAQTFGSQCIVVSVDPKRVLADRTPPPQSSPLGGGAWVGNRWEIYIKGGREATGIDAIEFAKQMEALGAGELLVNSIDRDGTKAGYDLNLLQAISRTVNIPVIASSGAGEPAHFAEAFGAGADAALAASLFHFQELVISSLKAYLKGERISLRE